MAKKVIAFDLDDTLAISKSAITDEMAELLSELVKKYEICIISGGRYEQFKKQVIDRLSLESHYFDKFHLMPSCGTRYYRWDDIKKDWKQLYAEDLTEEQKKKIIAVLEEGAKELGVWEENPRGDIIEDRGSQITFSALGQQALPADKYAWDPDGKKKYALRDYVAERLDGLEVRAGGTTSVDITRIGIDKAYGMHKLMDALEISKDEILFIGDNLKEGGNDYPVKAMGIDTIAVERWEDTALVLQGLIKVS